MLNFLDSNDICKALFGTDRFPELFECFAKSQLTPSWVEDAVFVNRHGPSYTRVSGVLIASPVLPWTVNKAPICLWHNPWATKPFAMPITALSQIHFNDGVLEHRVGTPLHTLLELDESWPPLDDGE